MAAMTVSASKLASLTLSSQQILQQVVVNVISTYAFDVAVLNEVTNVRNL